MNKPVRVLIVEDSEDDVRLTLRALRRGGFDPAYKRVQTAAELESALVAEHWDAVISDFSMPGFTGLDALGIFRSTGLDIPFILVSGNIGEEIAVGAMKAGASDYLMKQNLARLAPALERELKETKRRAVHRKAQRDLIESEEQSRNLTATQAAILNTLPAHIALLDAQGLITSVNEAWRRFAVSNVLQCPGHGIGVNYLEICDSARGDDSAVAQQAAAGIRLVLSGGVKSYSIEYACHSPTEQRWFLLMVTPLNDDRPLGAVVMHVNITESHRAAGELRESERRFSDMLGNLELVSVMLDREARITYCNEYLLHLTGWRHEEVIGRDWFELFMPAELGNMKSVFQALLADRPEAWHRDNELFTRSGERRLIRWNNSVLRSGSGEVIGTASIGEDITEQRLAETSIKRLNRLYAVLSDINSLIVRVRDLDELFREACRIAVDHGRFRMAWIGVVDRANMKLVPVASAGAAPDFLELIKQRSTLPIDAPFGNTLIARAIREKKAAYSNDVQNDPNVLFKEEHAERGSRSMAILPLQVSDEVVGALALYSEETGFFDEEEMKLLTGLSGDIAFAIDHIDKQERLDYLAYYDELTGLANRRLFLDRVAQYMRSAVSGGHKLALFFLDLERFRNINDSLGRPAGDALLKQVSEWLSLDVGDENLVAHLGADHFAIVLPELKQEGNVAHLLDMRFRAFLDHPFRLNDTEFRITTKVGVAIFPNDGTDAETLLQNAEAALKKAKASGDRFLFYTQKMTETVAGKLTLENQLRQALEKEEFVLHYQPKVNLATGKLTSAEALIRWNDPRTGLVPPGQFIPILEETGLIHEVGRWALHQAIEDYLRWRAAGLAAVRIAVNVSPLQLRHRGFIAEIEEAIGIDEQAAAGLELELTESVIMEDVKHSIATLQAIRAMGVSLAIDDFGTGFSSLSYLAKLPVDTLKIDRSFVIDMMVGPEGLALVSTIINLAHSLKLNVVAEGVETEEQSRLLRLLDCDEMQGFLFCKPVPVETFEARFLYPSTGI